METTDLIKRLTKLNILHTIDDVNEYNKDLIFIINKIKFKASFTSKNNTITDYCRVIAYDKTNQEHQYRFFNNFSQLLKYANN